MGDESFLEQAGDLMGLPPVEEPDEDTPPVDVPPEKQEEQPPIDDKPIETPVETPPPDEVPPDVDERDALIEQMRAQIAELSRGQSGEVWPQQPTPAETVPTEGGKPQVQPQQQQQATLDQLLTEVNYLTEEELDQVIDNPQLINKAISKARMEMAQTITNALPGVVSQMVEQQMLVMRAVQAFYDQNDDLRPYGDFVKFKMSAIERSNPNMTYQEIFNKTAEECRKGLGLKNPDAKERDKPSGTTKPAFTAGKKTSVQRPAERKNEIFDPNAADLMDLL